MPPVPEVDEKGLLREKWLNACNISYVDNNELSLRQREKASRALSLQKHGLGCVVDTAQQFLTFACPHKAFQKCNRVTFTPDAIAF